MKQETYISENENFTSIHYVSTKAQREIMKQLLLVSFLSTELLPLPTEGIMKFTIEYLDNKPIVVIWHPVMSSEALEKSDYDDEYWQQYDKLTIEEKVKQIEEIENRYFGDNVMDHHKNKNGVRWREEMAILERLKSQL